MRSKEEIEKLSPIEAYNLAVQDCADSAEIICTGDRATMGYQNVSPRDIQFFDVDPQTILKNKISQ
ncbi:hypothetical protein IT401_02615 [Candidatus Nomurabacteria bacterium]|nr:hypothetical protein [Candidatus Nomurabacteria bacterium]